jgi:H+/Cl- antiporter ClcA
MNQTPQKNKRNRRRSLLTGLVFIIIIASLGLATDCFEYQQVAMWKNLVRSHARLDSFNSTLQATVENIEDNQRRIWFQILAHAGLIIIASWCLLDANKLTGSYLLEVAPPSIANGISNKER